MIIHVGYKEHQGIFVPYKFRSLRVLLGSGDFHD